MSMPLLAAVIVSGGQLHRVYFLSTTLAIIDALVALLGPVRNKQLQRRIDFYTFFV